MACLGVIGLIALLALIARGITGQRGKPMEPYNSAVRPLNAPPFEDGDFSGIPTTGPVQDYERDAPPEQIIGSSGFEGRQYGDEFGDEEDRL